MLVLYYVLIFLLSAAGIFGLKFILKKYDDKKDKILKIVSLSLFVTMFVRYMLGDDAISTTQGLNVFSPFGSNLIFTLLGLLLVWFSYSSMFLVTLYSFSKLNNIKNVIKFFVLPLNVIVDGDEYLDGVTINQEKLYLDMTAGKNIKTCMLFSC